MQYLYFLAVLILPLGWLCLRLIFGGCFRWYKSWHSSADVVGRDTMKAACYDRHGDITRDVLRVNDAEPIPNYASNEVLIRVYASSLNPVDFKFLHGSIAALECIVGIGSHSVPGFDVAGVVVATGKDCTRLRVGDCVFAMGDFTKRGTVSEYVNMEEHRVVVKPASLSFNEAATIPLVAQTSYQAMVELGHLDNTGQRVLILGGAGGTGTAAIQIAKHFNAFVVTTASPRNTQLVTDLGADQVINYREKDWEDELKGGNFDIVYACITQPDTSAKARSVLKKGGHYISINGDPGGLCAMVAGFGGACCCCGGPSYDLMTCYGTGDRMQLIADMVDAKGLVPVVDKVFSLDQAIEAFEYIEAGKCQGKLVISVMDPENTGKGRGKTTSAATGNTHYSTFNNNDDDDDDDDDDCVDEKQALRKRSQ